MDLSGLSKRLIGKFLPSGSVIKQTVRSGVWEGGMNVLNRAIQLTKVLILARLLPPNEFGILGIGFLVLAVFEHFSQLGIDQALIQQKRQRVDEYLNTAWVLQIGRGLLLTSTMFFIAPIAASWFGEPRATNVIRVLGIGPLLLGLKNPGVMYFRKNLQFHRRFVQVLSGTIANFAVAVVLGVLVGNVWALVAGSVVGNIISVVVSYLLHGYRPWPELDLDRAAELVDYGKWIFGSGITTFLASQGDDVFVGWFFGATPLAFYQMGYRFSNAPATELADVIASVSFPSFSKIQSDYRKLRTGYFRTLRLTTFLSFPAAVGIAAVAPTFVRAFLGSEWLATIPIMQALAVWGALRALGANNVPVFKALSRPDIGTKISVVRTLLIGIGIYPLAVRFDVLGVAAAIVSSSLIMAPIESYITLRLTDGAPLRYVRNLVHPLLGSVIMGGVAWMIQVEWSTELLLLKFIGLVLVGVLIYSLYMSAAVGLFNYRIIDELRIIRNAF